MSATRRPLIENASHQGSVSMSRVSEIAIQADRDGDSEEEDQPTKRELDFLEPFLFSDATLIVQNHKLHCHRAILSIHSPVFKAMFYNRCILMSDMHTEFKENQKNEVNIPGDTVDDVREVLMHLYTPGGCDMTAESAQRLMPIIHRYQMDHLVAMAERAMAFRLTDSSAPSCLQLADMYGLTKLRQAALDTCARFDIDRLNRMFKDADMSSELRSEILVKRVSNLEKCLIDIQNSFTHSCTRVETRMERIASNHCIEHPGPLTQIRLVIPSTVTCAGETTPANEDGHDLPQPQQAPNGGPDQRGRVDISASILPASAALRSVDMRPVEESTRAAASEGHGQLHTQGTTTNAQVPPSGPTVVCDKCSTQLRNHIIELCKRGLHKIPIVMMRNS